ncbi:MAG: type II secretion system F family protein [Terrimicrobiaceae bacterium]
MAKFEYKGIDASGATVSKTEEGTSIDEVSLKLMEMGISVLEIKPVASFGASDPTNLDKGGPANKKQSLLSSLFGSVSNKELKIFYVNLATLVSAGISLRSCVNALAEQAENPYFQTIMANISQSIEAGKPFSEAVAQHPKVFPGLFVNMLRAGEESGKLDEVLRRYAIYCEKQDKIVGKLKGAMIMPVILILVASGVVTGLLVYVFPTFMKLFAGKEDMLPGPTKLVMAISNFLQYNYLQLIGYGTLIVVAMKLILNSDIGWRVFCTIQMKAPLLGNLFRKSYIATFCQNMATMLKAGVASLRALKIAQDSISNVVMRDVVNEIYDSVERGSSFSAPMKKNSQLFPTMVTLMVNIGEESGTLNQMFEKISEYYEAETEEAINAFLTAIEPLITIVMGMVVCLIAMSMFLPLFDLGKTMK